MPPFRKKGINKGLLGFFFKGRITQDGELKAASWLKDGAIAWNTITSLLAHLDQISCFPVLTQVLLSSSGKRKLNSSLQIDPDSSSEKWRLLKFMLNKLQDLKTDCCSKTLRQNRRWMLCRALTMPLTPSVGSNGVLSRPVIIFLPVTLLTLQSSVGMLHSYSFPFCSGIGMGRHLFHISTGDGGRSHMSWGIAGGGFFGPLSWMFLQKQVCPDDWTRPRLGSKI